jgi:hypothetical protein
MQYNVQYGVVWTDGRFAVPCLKLPHPHVCTILLFEVIYEKNENYLRRLSSVYTACFRLCRFMGF